MLGKPKTPEALEGTMQKDSNLPATLPFPFFPSFPTAPGLIPHPINHPMFPRFPLPLGRGSSGPPSVLHNMPLPTRFMPPNMKIDESPSMRQKAFEREQTGDPASSSDQPTKIEIDEIGKGNKFSKQDQTHASDTSGISETAGRYESFSIGVTTVPPNSHKTDKLERIDKVKCLFKFSH